MPLTQAQKDDLKTKLAAAKVQANAAKSQAQTSVSSSTNAINIIGTLEAAVAALVVDGTAPPPPTDTDADVGDDLKVTVAAPSPGLVVNCTVSGLDADASAAITFTAGTKTLIVPVTANGAKAVTLTGFPWGTVTASIVATDVGGNKATGFPATFTLTNPVISPPPPPPPLPTGIAAAAFGPFDKSAATLALGGTLAEYEKRFALWADKHWTAHGAKWEGMGGASYDDQKMNYIWYERTGDVKYLNRAHALVLDYRDRYIGAAARTATNPDGWEHPPTWWSQYIGLALHYKHTGDERSRRFVGNGGDAFCWDILGRRYTANISGSWNDNRGQHKAMGCVLGALYIAAPSDGAPDMGIPGGNDWRKAADQLLADIISTQNAAGYWRFTGPDSQVWFYPYQMGLVTNSMIDYWHFVAQDPRIPVTVKKYCDWAWAKARDTRNNGFFYIMEDNSSEGEPGPSTVGSPDIAMMSLNAYGFMWHVSGNTFYRDCADAMLASAMTGDNSNTPPGSYLEGYKQFQQNYSFGYRYPFYRQSR